MQCDTDKVAATKTAQEHMLAFLPTPLLPGQAYDITWDLEHSITTCPVSTINA